MEYKIVGDVMQALQVELQQGEELYAEAGAMLYMGPGIDLQARMQGGLMKGLMRKFLAGESLFMSVFRCNAATGAAGAGQSDRRQDHPHPAQRQHDPRRAQRLPLRRSATSICRSPSPSASARGCSAARASSCRRSAARAWSSSTPAATCWSSTSRPARRCASIPAASCRWPTRSTTTSSSSADSATRCSAAKVSSTPR